MDGALEDMKGKKAQYYPELEYSLQIPGVCIYQFKGVLLFDDDDRTIVFEQGEGFGLSREQIEEYLVRYEIQDTSHSA